jgi:hypothetical protein
MSPNRFSAVRALGVLGAAGAVACGDTPTTAPTDAAAASRATLTLSATDSTAFVGAFADLRTRIEPSLGTTPTIAVLHRALAHVGAALASRNRTAAEIAIAEAEQAVTELASTPDDASSQAEVADQELDAVRLVLLQARAVLEPPSAIESRSDR